MPDAISAAPFARLAILGGFLLTAPLPALAQSNLGSGFGLEITPRGEQVLDLATGNTDLPQGGTVRDNKTGVTVVASFITIKPSDSLSAEGATLSTRLGGTLKAERLLYNQKTANITAKGKLTYSDNRIKNLVAQTLTVDTKTGAVTASGQVTASQPVLSAAKMVALPTKSVILLSGGASVQTFGKTVSGEQVLLNLVTGVAQTEASAGALAPFAPYLK